MLAAKLPPRETTLTFLPHRLNHQPVIVRGLTADELWITVGASAVCGLTIGVPLAFVTRTLPVAPTVIAVFIAFGIFVGGGLLRRHKRGRPDTWIYRQLQWRIAQRAPIVRPYIGARELITRSGAWTPRRTRSR